MFLIIVYSSMWNDMSTACSELWKGLFLAPSVCVFFACEISRELLYGFAPNSHGRHVWSLAWTSLKVKGQGHPGQKQHFLVLQRPECGLCLVKHL